uniref:Uncharacterized protein n=1 Tax=Tetranychus urticae TaxID=32264 RepID=T1JXJ4_TETUR
MITFNSTRKGYVKSDVNVDCYKLHLNNTIRLDWRI